MVVVVVLLRGRVDWWVWLVRVGDAVVKRISSPSGDCVGGRGGRGRRRRLASSRRAGDAVLPAHHVLQAGRDRTGAISRCRAVPVRSGPYTHAYLS